MLDLTHLRSFVSVAQAEGFTLAAERLGIGQSTVSQHVQRLEKTVGRRLFERDTHRVTLTRDGEALLSHARAMLSIESRMQTLFLDRLHGTLRLGVSEDFVSSQLPLVLEDFVRAHPSVDLELTVALSGVLYEMQDNGGLDVVLAKRRLGDTRGHLIYREPLVWLARDEQSLSPDRPLPLIAFPAPSITRSIALEALGAIGLSWRIVCTCSSLSGLTAAARAGMGVLVQPRSMIPVGLRVVGASHLPALEDVEFVLVPTKGADPGLVSALSDDILARVHSLR